MIDGAVDMASLALDKEGYLRELADWNERVAVVLAAADAVTLSAAHWEIIWLLRDFYVETNLSPAMRALVRLVKMRLGEDKGNSIYLMTLFGASPAKSAAKYAGLPRPTHCL